MSSSPRTYSVVIPLYNKAAEVGRAVRSALAQTLQPLEVVVVDDGSTDSSAAEVEAVGSPLVRLIRQPNGGVSVARNRGIAEAKGDMVALLDADDEWRGDFLAEVDRMAREWPECGIYATGFDIASPTGMVAARGPERRGKVDFWSESMTGYVVIPSTAVVPRKVFDAVGGFPEGMRLGEDQWLWIKIATYYDVCYSPERLCCYSMVAANRSGATYRPEQTAHSLEELLESPYPTEHHDPQRAEFVAKCAIGKAIKLVARGDEAFGRRVAGRYDYTSRYRRGLQRLRVLLWLPRGLRGVADRAYEWLAWRLAHKGL